MIFCLSSCDVVTFAVRIATFRIFEWIISLEKIRFLLLKMNAIKHLKVNPKFLYYQKPVGLGQIFYSSFGRRTQQDPLSQNFAVTDKTWTNARIFFPHLPTCLKDTLFTPQKLHSHWFKFRLGITVVQRKRLINNGYKILTSRQTREKLQCLYENLMSNNFRKTAVLKKISVVN